MKTKCNECNKDGYIDDTKHSRHSCKCGWAIEQSMLKFKNVKIEDLLGYAHKRIQEKKMYE